MPVNYRSAGNTFTADDSSNLKAAIIKLAPLIAEENNHFTAGELVWLERLTKKLNMLADSFDVKAHDPLRFRNMAPLELGDDGVFRQADHLAE